MKKILILLFFVICGLMAADAQTEAGLTLLEATGARPAALSEAYTAVSNDITAFGYNPASLSTLNTGQASFSFQQGLLDDSYGQFLLGLPLKNKTQGLGLSVAYYDGGDIELLNENSVKAQRDLAVSLGWAKKLDFLSVGVSGKYLSSELVETFRATAFAGDIGIGFQLTPSLRIGGAVQNIGGKLKFNEEGDNLPRIVRGGAAIRMFQKAAPTNLLIDFPYYLNSRTVDPAIGIETKLSILFIRAGVQLENEEKISIGAGFLLGPTNLDYAFGLVDQLESQHRISASFRL